MKRWILYIFFIALLPLYLVPIKNCAAGIVIDSRVHLFSQAFKVSRWATDMSIDRIILPDVSLTVTYPFSQKLALITWYRYDYIVQSQLIAGLLYNRGSLLVSGGALVGFFNTVPIKTVPGLFGTAYLKLGRLFAVSLLGNTSFFLNPLFSLSQRSYNFDQNKLQCTVRYIGNNVNVILLYDNEGMYRTQSSDYKKNLKKRYEFAIKTVVPESWINSHTAFGGELSDFSTATVHQRFFQVYIDETLIFKLKTYNLSLGSRITLLNLTLKNIKSVSPPNTPSFPIHGGVTVLFSKK